MDYVAVGKRLARPALTATWWCGDPAAAVDHPDAGTLPTIHVLYAVPADGDERFAQFAPLIAADIEAIDQWWRAQDPSRAPRWDMYNSPLCADGAVALDIGFVRLPGATSSYLSSGSIAPLDREVLGFVTADEKVIVFYDAPRSEPSVCATSPIAALYPGALGTSFVWMRSDCMRDLGSGGIAAAVAAHELTHSLGAVPLEGPPNRCRDETRLGHVCDDPVDIMFPFASRGLSELTLDVGRNDYYGHTGDWWDVRDSRWLIRYPFRQVTVHIASTGGTGFVTSEAVGLECRADCIASVEDETIVRLRAVATPGSRLYGWDGVCSGIAAECVTTVKRDSRVGARFGPQAFRLNIAVHGSGRVVGAHVPCRLSCATWVPPGGQLNLIARPAKGWRFRRWTGRPCAGTKSTCRLRLDRDVAVAAVFERRR